jgi:opine dehydrogenase
VGIIGTGAIALATAALLTEVGHIPMVWSPSSSSNHQQPQSSRKDNDETKQDHHQQQQQQQQESIATDTDVITIQVTGKRNMDLALRVARSVNELVQSNTVIILCIPANGHKHVMDEIVPHLQCGQSVIISSHASFGALYLSQQLLRLHSSNKDKENEGNDKDNNDVERFQKLNIPITAWGTTVATARRPSSNCVRINTIRTAIDMTVIPAVHNDQAQQLCQHLFPQISNFVLRNGLIGITLSNLNPQNHLGIALGNISRMEKGEDWYQSLHITPAIGRLLEGLDTERLAIATKCHVTVKTIFEHFALSFHVPQSNNISEMNQDIHAQGNDVLGPNTADSRYVLEDVPYGLIPIIILGQLVGRPAILHEAGVTLISSMYGRDFRTENDLLQALQLEHYTLEDLQRAGETGVLLQHGSNSDNLLGIGSSSSIDSSTNHDMAKDKSCVDSF